MRVVVVTPPVPVIDFREVAAHLNLDADDASADIDLINTYMRAAQAHLDGPGKWLGRAIGVQTLEARLDNFDCGSIRLPFPEINSITSVAYVDGSGVAQTIADTGYELIGDALMPVYGASWPAPRWQREAVRVRYIAGYTYTTLPDDIRAALLLMVGDLYGNRETTLDARASGAVPIPMSTTVENLLSSYRVWS